jgi:hypothetical protein
MSMSPENAVERVARFVVESPVFTEDGVYAAMAAAGVPSRDADFAYKFTQASWGRMLLDGLGIKFADDYHCLNSNGDIVESGRLSEQPHFMAATQLSERYKGEAGFKRLAAMSADFHAVNQALHAGRRPENLVTAPLVLFLEPPTDAGMAKAQRLLAQLLASNQPVRPTEPRGKRSWLGGLFRRSFDD